MTLSPSIPHPLCGSLGMVTDLADEIRTYDFLVVLIIDYFIRIHFELATTNSTNRRFSVEGRTRFIGICFNPDLTCHLKIKRMGVTAVTNKALVFPSMIEIPKLFDHVFGCVHFLLPSHSRICGCFFQSFDESLTHGDLFKSKRN